MKVYVGIDVHRTFHEVAIIPDSLMTNGYQQTKTIKIKTNRDDFLKIISQIDEYRTPLTLR